MKVLAISGSPRKTGNTMLMLKTVLHELQGAGIETELESLSGKMIKPCNACMSCKHEPRCTIEDDDFAPLFEKSLQADGLILGSPVYFGSATPEIKAFIDRAGYIARNNKNPFRRKVGAPVVVARRAGRTFTYAQLMFFYTINEMILVGSSYWNVGIGRELGEVENDAEGMKTMRDLARNMAWVMKKLHA